ncbi:MAG TPA: IclR family transcriptional regulator [Gemmatimonadota bacterium]|nr:IclR family transcriptional regulator [Gemmatimonadota bacterium]
MPTKPYAGTQSVRRAMSLLKVFSDERPEWGLTEIAREARLNKTTAYRLLTALEAEGMVARGPVTEAWRLGPEAITLGALALRSNDLMAAARHELEALVRETGEAASLEVLVGDQVVILDGVEGPSVVGASPEVGTRWPAHATSTGKVLLAAERAGLGKRPGGRVGSLPRRLRRLTPRTITDPGRLDRELERVLDRGWATAIEELEVGYVAVGAPVRDHDLRVLAAISVGGPASRLSGDRIPVLARRVVRTADRVSRRLGGRGGFLDQEGRAVSTASTAGTR